MSTCLDLSGLHMRCCSIDRNYAVQEGNQVTEIEKMDRPTIQIPVSRVYLRMYSGASTTVNSINTTRFQSILYES